MYVNLQHREPHSHEFKNLTLAPKRPPSVLIDIDYLLCVHVNLKNKLSMLQNVCVGVFVCVCNSSLLYKHVYLWCACVHMCMYMVKNQQRPHK